MQIQLEISDDLYDQLKQQAEDRRTTIEFLVLESIIKQEG